VLRRSFNVIFNLRTFAKPKAFEKILNTWMVMLLLLLLLEQHALGAPCRTPIDCQLNGLCTAGSCVCHIAWTGANCGRLRLLSPPGFSPGGFHSLNSSSSAWGGGAVYDPTRKQWVGVFHEISHKCGMGTWGCNGQLGLAVGDAPAGPFTPTKLLLPHQPLDRP
jgi:hypothetical protein